MRWWNQNFWSKMVRSFAIWARLLSQLVSGWCAGHVLIMKEGRRVEQGSAIEVLQNPKAGYTRELIEAIHLGWG